MSHRESYSQLIKASAPLDSHYKDSLHPDNETHLVPNAQEVALELESQVKATFGKLSPDIIDQVLSRYFSDEKYSGFNLSLVEKIDVLLTLATANKIKISDNLLHSIKKLRSVLPNNKLLIEYLDSVKAQSRRRFLRAIALLILVISMRTSFLVVNNSSRSQFPTPTLASYSEVEQAAGSDEELLSLKARLAKAQFERLYSDDLGLVVAEIGWKKFLQDYGRVDAENVWNAEEVLSLLRTQEPRYWGYYVIKYPDQFLQAVAKSEVTLIDFMSSCTDAQFFSYFNVRSQEGNSWSDLWRGDELLQAVQQTHPDWIEIVSSNQTMFLDSFSNEDLRATIQQIVSDGSYRYEYDIFLKKYDLGWDEKISRRELLDIIKDNDRSWQVTVRGNISLFAPVLTKAEFINLVESIDADHIAGSPIFSTYDLKIFSDFYSLSFYRIIGPEEFVDLINSTFSTEIAQNVISENPALFDLQNRTIDDLFNTQAISYVLENYDLWKDQFPANEIMTYVREHNVNGNLYEEILPYPSIFVNIELTDDDIYFMAFLIHVDNVPIDEANHFSKYYFGEDGWHKQITVDRIIKIWRDKQQNVKIFPNFILPYFSDSDLFYLAYYYSDMLREADVLHKTDGAGQLIVSKERRRKLLDMAKQDPSTFDWKQAVSINFYFYEDVLSFEEAKEFLMYYPTPGVTSLLKTELWRSHVSPEAEYSLLKGFDDKYAFALAVTEDTGRFRHLLTVEDARIIFSVFPRPVLQNYRFWKKYLSPKDILYFLKQDQNIDFYSYYILENKQIFGHLFYGKDYTFRDLLRNLFTDNNGENQYYNYMIEEWLDIFDIQEVFDFLMSSEEGKRTVLMFPDLFFKHVKFADLDSFMQIDSGYDADCLLTYPAWQQLWSLSDLYDSAKKNNSYRAAYYFLHSKGWPIIAEKLTDDDLNFLVRSLTNETDSYSFVIEADKLVDKWTVDKVFATLQQERPTNWAAFINKNNVALFDTAVAVSDLRTLIQHGADPVFLSDIKQWEVGLILQTYREVLPDKWGEVVLTNSFVFKDEVKRENITLRELLIASDIYVVENELYNWYELWPVEEIKSIVLDIYPDFEFISQG